MGLKFSQSIEFAVDSFQLRGEWAIMQDLQELDQATQDLPHVEVEGQVTSESPARNGSESAHSARIAMLQRAAHSATERARAQLRAKGIEPVVWKDGEITVADD